MVNTFSKNENTIVKWIEYIDLMGEKEFTRMLKVIEVPYNPKFYHKLFSLFDFNKNRYITTQGF